MEGVVTEAKIFDNSWCPPTSGVQSVRFFDSFRCEVVEVMLHQFGEIVTEKYLELRVKLVGLDRLHLSDGVGGEDLGGGFPDDPGTMVISRNNTY